MNSKLPVAQNLEELLSLLNVAEKGMGNRRTLPKIIRKIEEIREKIPQPILGHFDRMRLRNRKPIAPVRHYVCMACHLQIPKNHVIAMRRTDEIDVCDNCGAFIYLDEAEETVSATPELVAHH